MGLQENCYPYYYCTCVVTTGIVYFLINPIVLMQVFQEVHVVTGQRPRYDSKSDAFPASREAERVFVSRVLRWHYQYCGRSRVCKDYTESTCYRCSPCQCDLTCYDYGDCCPDVALETQAEDFPRPFTGRDTNIMTCESTKQVPPMSREKINDDLSVTAYAGTGLKKSSQNSPQSHHYYMISQCPHTFTPDASECEKTEMVTPVTSASNDSFQVFKNVHCARCHGVLDVLPWNVQVSCEKRKNLTSLYSPRDVVEMALFEADCTVVYIPPASKEARTCYTEPDMINRCNVTGKWLKRDLFYEKACNSYVTPKRVGHVLYKNPFCYLCNYGDELPVQLLLKECQRVVTHNYSVTVTLLQSDVEKSSYSSSLGSLHFKTCAKHGIYDYIEDSCRQVTCSLGQHLTSGSCQPMFVEGRGIGYELYFAVRPEAPIDVTGDHDLRHLLPAEVEIYLSKTLLHGKARLEYFAMTFNTTNSEGHCGQMSDDLAVYAQLITHTMIDQRQLQDHLLQIRHANFSIAIENWNMSFQSFPSESVWFVMQQARSHSPHSLSSCVIIVSNTHLEQRKDGIRRVGTTTPDPSKPLEEKSPPHIRISSLMECPHVRLLPHEYSWTGPDKKLTLLWSDAAFSTDQFLVDMDRNISVCLSVFLKKFGDIQKIPANEQILAHVLIAVSMTCLVVTLIVFLVFSVLRSLSGKNNIVLVVSLFCTQLSLFLSYLVDDFSKLCVAFGISTHYFTLCLYCCLMVCSYHVYAMFTTMHLSKSMTKDRRYFVVYCCFTCLVPLLVVGTVIIFHVAHKPSSRSFGYGCTGSICLLSSAVSLWLSVFLPLVTSFIVVAILFGMTSSSLRHNTDLEISATDERHVHFYFRAALLTLVTWIVGIAGILTSLSPVRIAFIVLQFVLGMYVFGSLVLTPRVSRLLSGACCQSRRPPRGRTSLNMKMASSQECPVRPQCIVGTGYRKRDLHSSGGGMVDLPGKYTQHSEFAESSA